MSWEFQGELPSIVKIDGADYYLHSDYRVSVEFAELMESDLADDEKWIRALELYFGGIPQNINAAVESIVSFYSCGKMLNLSRTRQQNRKIFVSLTSRKICRIFMRLF